MNERPPLVKPPTNEQVEKNPSLDYYFVVDVTKSEPPIAEQSLRPGGLIKAAATPWETDMATSSATESVFIRGLGRLKPKRVHLPLTGEGLIKDCVQKDHAENILSATVFISEDMRVNFSTSHIAPSLNGTLVSSVSGQGSELLSNIIQKNGIVQLGLEYASWLAHAATMGMGSAHVIGVPRGQDPATACTKSVIASDVKFEKLSPYTTNMLQAAMMCIELYVKHGGETRDRHVYEPSPLLSKLVFKDPVGVIGQGYNLLHDIVDRGSPFGLTVLNSLFEAGIDTTFTKEANKEDDMSSFLQKTNKPSLGAAKQAWVVASAASFIVNYLIAYRTDGGNVLLPSGSTFVPAESWLWQLARGPFDGNDCDGAALLIIGLINAAVSAAADFGTKEAKEQYKYINAVRNVIHPYYHIGLCVVGAAAPEATATSQGTTKSAKVAGHAIAVFIPTIHLMRAMANVNPVESPQENQSYTHEDATNARFNAIFSQREVNKMNLPEEEVKALKTWQTAIEYFVDKNTELRPFAIEGTTPCSPTMYEPDEDTRRSMEESAKRDGHVFHNMPQNVFRGIRSLHVGGPDDKHTHVFYRELVELTLSSKSPFYTDPELRRLEIAASQYVFSNIDGTAGVTPKNVVMQEYALIPLVRIGTDVGNSFDFAARKAKKDVIPPRKEEPTQLTAFQSKVLKKSMKHIADLDNHFNERDKINNNNDNANAHSVWYLIAYNTLIHSDNAVQDFVRQIQSKQVGGKVYKRMIKGLAVNSDNEAAGHYVVINVGTGSSAVSVTAKQSR